MRPRHVFLLLVCTAFLLTGCSSGGNDGTAGTITGTGTVALMLTDGPADDYDAMNITISRVLLLHDGVQTVVYEPDAPEAFDLLDLRSEGEGDAGELLSVMNIPAGTYDKIRLEVAPDDDGQYVVLGVKDGTETEFRLPGRHGHIDFNPRGPFTVPADSMLVITLDIDCDKSIHTSATNLFRPAVFVDITVVDEAQAAGEEPLYPRILEGTVSEIYEDGQETTGFELILKNGAARVPVRFESQTRFFNGAGEPAEAWGLHAGNRVTVQARLHAQGLVALVVVTADDQEVDILEGIVTQDMAGNQFQLNNAYTIQVAEGARFLWGRDEDVDPQNIRARMQIRLLARKQAHEGYYYAYSGMLNHQVEGTLTDIRAAEGGNWLTVLTEASEAIDLFLPDTACIGSSFGGELGIEELIELVDCNPPVVRINLDPQSDPLTAKRLAVIFQRLPEGSGHAVIEEIADSLLTVEFDAAPTIVQVRDGAYILDVCAEPPAQSAAVLDDLLVGDEVVFYGFPRCADLVSFDAWVVLVTSQCVGSLE